MNCIAEINTHFLTQNLTHIRRKVGDVKIMAMVKADAYGHGMSEVVRALEEANDAPEYYGITFLDEALALQEITKKPILMTEPCSKGDVQKYLENASEQVMPVLSSQEDIDAWGTEVTRIIRVHIKVNSGMNRLGVRKEEAVAFIQKVMESEKFVIDGVYTHFATSDEKDKTFAEEQLATFKEIISHFDRKDLGIIHTANSGAILDMPESYFDMVRPGILLYGYYPSTETSASIEVTPAMSLYSILSEVSYVEKGESVGYGATYRAPERHRTASVPMGYADGIARGLSGKMRVLIEGSFYNQIGTISMDRMSINLEQSAIQQGNRVTLIGREGERSLDFSEWADILHTIPYELMCGIGKRFKREYKNTATR